MIEHTEPSRSADTDLPAPSGGQSLLPASEDPPAAAFAAALSGVPYLSPPRLRQVLERISPGEAWQAVCQGRSADPLVDSFFAELRRRGHWRPPDRRLDPAEVWRRCETTGVAVSVLGRTTYPPLLAADLAAPAVLFSRGDFRALDHRRVAIVGTRNATAAGREIAAELGAELAQHGICVVSGLARGIDGWAHRGALRATGAPPVGVVACGLDVVYPSEHRQLWDAVSERGLLLSEWPPGTSPEPYRFPLRNRVLAALAEVVVVVESRARGGSLVTVDEAIKRGVPVIAVPGSPRNPAAEGTNRLIVDGCAPVLDATDVLVALGFARPVAADARRETRPSPDPSDRRILNLFGSDALDLSQLVALTDESVPVVALALARLEAAGWLRRTGAWYERLSVAPSGPLS